jgi:hypothetical protein
LLPSARKDELVDRQELYVQAEQKMLEPGPVGEAWRYIYELTSQEKSHAWLKTMLNRAANDPNIPTVKRHVYFDASSSLTQVRVREITRRLNEIEKLLGE